MIKSEIENGATEASGNTEKTEIEVQVPMTDGNGPTNIEESQSIPATNFSELNQPNLPDKIDEKPHSPENLTVTYTHFICLILLEPFNLQKIFSITLTL